MKELPHNLAMREMDLRHPAAIPELAIDGEEDATPKEELSDPVLGWRPRRGRSNAGDETCAVITRQQDREAGRRATKAQKRLKHPGTKDDVLWPLPRRADVVGECERESPGSPCATDGAGGAAGWHGEPVHEVREPARVSHRPQIQMVREPARVCHQQWMHIEECANDDDLYEETMRREASAGVGAASDYDALVRGACTPGGTASQTCVRARARTSASALG